MLKFFSQNDSLFKKFKYSFQYKYCQRIFKTTLKFITQRRFQTHYSKLMRSKEKRFINLIKINNIRQLNVKPKNKLRFN